VNTLGQFIFALGGATVNYREMLIGRVIYGLGTITVTVAQSTALATWFKGRELGIAFGASFLADFSELF
jgi:MFS family permease